MDWNRKDSTPICTIKRIKDILGSLKADVNLTNVINNKDKLFSCRLEFEHLPGIGTNGKGVSLEYAQASAYAEFMERLQTGMLLDKWFPRKKKDFTDLKFDTYEVLSVYRKYFNDFIADKINDEFLMTLFERNSSFGQL